MLMATENGLRKAIKDKLKDKLTSGLKKSKVKPKSLLSTLLESIYESEIYLNTDFCYQSLTHDQRKKIFLDEILKILIEKRNQVKNDSVEDEISDVRDEIRNATFSQVLFAIHNLDKMNDEEDKNALEVLKKSAQEYLCEIFYVDKIDENSEITSVTKSQDDFQSHVNLIKAITRHEIKTSESPFIGNFNILSRAILSIHAEFLKMDKRLEILAHWTAFIEIHKHHRLDLILFRKFIYKVSEIFQRNDEILFDSEFYRAKFIASSSQLSKDFLECFENLNSESSDASVMENVLAIEKEIYKIRIGGESDAVFNEVVKKSLADETKKHFQSNFVIQAKIQEKKLKELLEVLKLIIEHYKKICEKFANIFDEHCKFSFVEFLYYVYDGEINQLAKNIIEEYFDSHKKITNEASKDLYLIYSTLNEIADYGILKHNAENLKLTEFYKWFDMNEEKWDIVKAFKMQSKLYETIDAAVKKDKLQLYSGKFSSSAFDVSQLLIGIQKEWKSFKCSDENLKQRICDRLAEEIWNATKFYFDKLLEKAKKESSSFAILLMPQEAFVVILNVIYMSERCCEFMKNFMTVDKFERIKNEIKAHEERLISKIMKKMLRKASRMIKKALNKNSTNQLEIHDLTVLSHLKNFHKILVHILELFELVIAKSKALDHPPNFFESLNKIFLNLCETFEVDDKLPDENRNIIVAINRKLHFKSLSTQDLIKMYRDDIKNMAKELNSPSELRVQSNFDGNSLEITILNWFNMNELNPNKKWIPYVKISLEPKNIFNTAKDQKTTGKGKDSNCAIIDEKFEFYLAEYQRNAPNACVVFRIKKRAAFGRSSSYVAETSISFEEIFTREATKKFSLKLSRLKKDHEGLEVLKSRKCDEDAKHFIAKVA